MSILLDTNALVWLLSNNGEKRFGPHAKELLQNADIVYASSVSVLEIRIKEMLNKISAPQTLLQDIAAAGLKELPFSMEHADTIKNFPNFSRHDPFDRMLFAQAQVERVSLLTSDKLLLDQKLGFVLNARV